MHARRAQQHQDLRHDLRALLLPLLLRLPLTTTRSYYNHLENNTWHGKQFPTVPGQTRTNAEGAAYLAHIWSSFSLRCMLARIRA